MPQARRAGSGSRSSGGSTRRTTGSSRSGSTGRASTGSRAKSAASGRSSSGTRSTRATKTTKATTSAKSTTARAARATSARAGAAEAQLEAVAQRLRKLNERIIQAGREAGENTLTSYEKALKTIATTIERGPGSSDIEWVANLATAQAKLIRELITPLTERARKALK